jgi:hypothetical protein
MILNYFKNMCVSHMPLCIRNTVLEYPVATGCGSRLLAGHVRRMGNAPIFLLDNSARVARPIDIFKKCNTWNNQQSKHNKWTSMTTLRIFVLVHVNI